MLKNLGIVEVSPDTGPNGYERLASRRFGGKSLIEWVVRRVSDAQLLDGVIAVFPDADEGREIAQLVPPDVPVFLSGEADALGRIVAAIREYPTVAVVRVAVHSPFVDPALIDGLVRVAQQHRGCDYISYCSRDGRPTVQLQLGLFAEWCRSDAVRQAARETLLRADRCEVTRYLYSHPEVFQLRLIPIPSQLDRSDLRLTIGRQEDWEHAEEIFDALGPECLDWQRIAGLLDQQPALRERMAVLNRADARG